jgi:hypothetical protein
MTNLISRAFAHISSLLKGLQVKRFSAVVLVGFLLLTTNVALGQDNTLGETIRDQVHQTDQADRPKTTGEWNAEARETEGSPGKRLQRIGKESAEAFKQFGSGYAEGAKETAGSVRDNTVGAR